MVEVRTVVQDGEEGVRISEQVNCRTRGEEKLNVVTCSAGREIEMSGFTVTAGRMLELSVEDDKGSLLRNSSRNRGSTSGGLQGSSCIVGVKVGFLYSLNDEIKNTDIANEERVTFIYRIGILLDALMLQ